MNIIDLKDKHPLIYKRALECCDEGDDEHSDLDIAFLWYDTKEGYNIWAEIYHNSNFQPFYDFHELENPENESEFKAGDVVEYNMGDTDWEKGVFVGYWKGYPIVETKYGGIKDAVELRKPKDKLKEKAEEITDIWFSFNDNEQISKEVTISAIKSAIKWGQNNPTEK